MQITSIVGIDVSKDKLDVCLRPATAPEPRLARTFANDRRGWTGLQAWLDKQKAPPAHACLEATSRYGDGVAAFLHGRGHVVSVVNPRRVRHYAESRLARTRHDRIDAGLIADFCAQERPRAWAPPSPGRSQLQELVRARAFFQGQKQRCANRLETASALTAGLLRREVGHLEKRVALLEKQIEALLEREAELGRQVQLAESIPGVGRVTAAVAVAELPEMAGLEHAGQAVAFAGLDPVGKESGISVRTPPHLSKMGSRLLRQTLYMASLCAKGHNPALKVFAQRLRERGKPGKVVVCAVMRKLVRLLFGVLKHGRPFDPEWMARTRAQGRGQASGGEELASLQLASPPVATA